MPLSGIKSTPELQKAASLAPGNPRLLLVAALAAYRQEAQGRAGAWERVQQQFVAAVAAFDAEGASVSGASDWGHAEALAYLGKISILRRDHVGARNALERAVLVAPDYRWAGQMLKSLPAIAQ